MLRNFRKPLVIAAPKVGLKHTGAVSDYSEMASGTSFRPIIIDHFGPTSKSIEKVIFCSGRIFFDIR